MFYEQGSSYHNMFKKKKKKNVNEKDTRKPKNEKIT